MTLDPKERFCGCGGVGHLEGFLGYRSIRLRFLDMEPDEAAASATSIHMAGPGPFYLTGLNAGFLDVGLLDRLVHDMVKMSPLQGSRFELIPENDELGVIGAAVNAERALRAG